MPKGNYVESNDITFGSQLTNFKNEIPNYAAVLHIPADQVTSQAADADYFDCCLKQQAVMQNAAMQTTEWKDLMRDGGTPPAAGAPVAPTLPKAVPVVAPGIEGRFRGLVKQIKAHPSYNAAIGNALGIEGAQHVPPELTTVRPEINAEIRGDHVLITWGWNGNGAYLDMCELQVDRGDGKGFVLLAFDTTPGYTDTEPFPTPPTRWTYRAIFRVGDGQVGQWSRSVTITVPG